MNSMLRQIHNDQNLGPAFLRARWHVVDTFINANGLTTMLELCQAHPAELYLEDMIQYALGVLQIVTLVPKSRNLIVNAFLRNGGFGIAVILEAAHDTHDHDIEIAEKALNILVNLVCPPPSITDKPSAIMKVQGSASTLTSGRSAMDSGDRSVVAAYIPCQSKPSEWNGESSLANGGAGACRARLTEQLELGYSQARKAVYANDGIRTLLDLLQTETVESHIAIHHVNALVCQILLGLARDDKIARILIKLQVEKKISALIQDSGSRNHSGRQRRWQAELAKVATELIWVLTNSGHPSTLAPGDYAAPIWRRIERASIVVGSPISYHPRELLLLIHEHLQATGLAESAATVLRESRWIPFPSLGAPPSLQQEVFAQEASALQIQWPSGRSPCGFLLHRAKVYSQQEDSGLRCDLEVFSSMEKSSPSSMARGHSIQPKLEDSVVSSNSESNLRFQKICPAADLPGTPSASALNSGGDVRVQMRDPAVSPMKRKLTDLKNNELVSSRKRVNTAAHILGSPGFTFPNIIHSNGLLDLPVEDKDRFTGSLMGQVSSYRNELLNDPQHSGKERVTLDSLVIQYLTHQHHQCPAPITTSAPLSLLHPHVCPAPKRSLEDPSNVAARISTREFRSSNRVIQGKLRDRQFVYSKFRLCQTCRDDSGSVLTCLSFLGDSSRIATGDHSGELKVFDFKSNKVLESCKSHRYSPTLLESHFVGENQLLLSSSSKEVCLWDMSLFSGGPRHYFEGIRNARFSHFGSIFAAIGSGPAHKDIILYDVHTCQADLRLVDTISSVAGHWHSHLHFSPSDSMVLWNGILWDRRSTRLIHRFNQLTNFEGGGFHPTRNEVIINSEVWDLRKFYLLQSVPSLDQTTITFSSSGDVIYAIMKKHFQDFGSWFNNRSGGHTLSSAFRTVDAVTYSHIATVPMVRAIFDFATESTDSFVGLVTPDGQDNKSTSARVYEIGRRKLSGDDSDRDDPPIKAKDDDDENLESEDDPSGREEEMSRSVIGIVNDPESEGSGSGSGSD